MNAVLIFLVFQLSESPFHTNILALWARCSCTCVASLSSSLCFCAHHQKKFPFQSLIKRNLSRSLINLRGHEGSGPQRCQLWNAPSQIHFQNKTDFLTQNPINYLNLNRGLALETDSVRISSCWKDVRGVAAAPSLFHTLENIINHRCFLYQSRLLSPNRIISRSSALSFFFPSALTAV